MCMRVRSIHTWHSSRWLKNWRAKRRPHWFRAVVQERFIVLATKQIVQYLGTGRRKTAVARVFLRPGSGAIKVNNREFENYFVTEASRTPVRQALVATEMLD